MSGSRQISPISPGWPEACFWPGTDFGATAPVVFGGAAGDGAAAVDGAFGNGLAPFGAPLAMLLVGLEGIGGPTRVQGSPPQRKPSTQP